MTAPNPVSTLSFLNGTSGTHGYVQFTPTNAVSYNIYRAEQPFKDFVLVANTDLGTYTDNTVRDQKEYKYYIVGLDASNNYSLPSYQESAFVYSGQFNFLNNTLQALQAEMKSELPFFNDVKIGKYDVIPEILPYSEIFVEEDNEENISIGHTGQVDKIYNINIRIYTNGAGQNNETVEAQLMEYTGKTQSLLEALKSFSPYWYISDITSTEYGNVTLDAVVLRFADIKWQCKRRVLRSN
jgi:hypothetical protein